MRLVLASILLASMALPGCVRVKPFERGHLASPCMAVGLSEESLLGEYHAKYVESKTGGGAPGSAPGGGCGCAQ